MTGSEPEQEYTPHPGPWTCFQCEETFVTRQEAADHFSLDCCELPACVQILTEGERAIVEDRRMWRNRALEAESENEALGHQVNSFEYGLRQFGSEVRTIWLANDRYQCTKSQLERAEAKVRELVLRLVRAGVPWEPLEGEHRTQEDILRGGR